MTIHQATEAAILEAVTRLQNGGLVAFPTETVYGLGADAASAHAVTQIYALKQRPSFNPLIAHVHDLAAAQKIAVFDARAHSLAQVFWPGPLTLVLPQQHDNNIADIVTAGLPTIAVRVPSHPVALALLAQFGKPVAAPSANISGTVSPTSALHVAHSFGDQAPYILAGGAAHIGLESTILDLSATMPVLLRPGSITRDQIEAVIGPVAVAATDAAITAPGQLARHYATATKLRLHAVDVKQNEALLAFGPVKFMGVADYGFAKDMPQSLYRNLSTESDLSVAAANLFRMLREMDAACIQSHVQSIAVMAIPADGIGIAINDRLQRAATPAG